MKIRHLLITATAVVVGFFSVNAMSNWWPFSSNAEVTASQQEITELTWDNLIPDDFVQPENPFLTMTQAKIDQLMDGTEASNAELAELQEGMDFAPVVDSLNGQRVRIPAYITPLEFNEDSTISEFLLVPYVGACLHVPPPPANQIVHAQSPAAIKFKDINDPVWAVGVIRTESVTSALAESGYRLEVEDVRPYTEE